MIESLSTIHTTKGVGVFSWHVPEERIGAAKVRSSGLIGQSHRVLESTRLTQSGPRAHRIAFRKAAALNHRDTSKRERRSIVAQRHAVQGAEGITASSARAAAVIGDSNGIPPHLLLPPFDFRCQTISRPTTSEWDRASATRREFAQIRRFQKP